MRRALRLAARGFTAPNPMVGCVLAVGNEIVGEGYHHHAGAPHAEVVAIEAAGGRSKGAAAYVTLEPCSHFGRTGPCAQALIAAGVRRVVFAVEDPNPAVCGSGAEMLRAAGVDVESGLCRDEAVALNRPFFVYHKTGWPFVTLKAAMTLDGKIATHTGDSKWITSAAARRYGHLLRARSSAVLVGIGTVLADDPMLTARLPEVVNQPVRIVLDPSLRLPADSQLVRSASRVATWVVTSRRADRAARAELERSGVRIIDCDQMAGGSFDLAFLLQKLGGEGLISVLVEGGAETHARFVERGLVDRVQMFVAPKIFGGRGAPGPVGGAGVEVVDMALQLGPLHMRRIGGDVLLVAEKIWE